MNKQIAALATDEENMVMWDMDALLLDYKGHPYITVETEKLLPQSWLTIDTEYAPTTNVNTPIILFELPDDRLYIADGNHRLYKAATGKIPTMNVIVIPQEKHLSYLFRSTPALYRRVIEGLTGEGIFIQAVNELFLPNGENGKGEPPWREYSFKLRNRRGECVEKSVP